MNDTVPQADAVIEYDENGGETLAVDPGEHEPETVPARELERGQVINLREIDRAGGPAEYREVRLVEPDSGTGGDMVLIVVAGAWNAWVDGDTPVRPVPDDEYQAYLAHRAEMERRAEMSRALRTLADLLDSGLPVPAHLQIEGILDSTPTVQAAAAVLGEEMDTKAHGDWHTRSAQHHFGRGKADAVVSMRLWHGWNEKPAGGV